MGYIYLAPYRETGRKGQDNDRVMNMLNVELEMGDVTDCTEDVQDKRARNVHLYRITDWRNQTEKEQIVLSC